MRNALVFSLLVWFVSSCGYNNPEVGTDPVSEPAGKNLTFVTLNAFNEKTNDAYGDVLNDIVQHTAPGDTNNYDDLVTMAHETTHGIQSYLRNKYETSAEKVNAFYMLKDRGVILVEPPIRKADVGKYIPESLRGSRYDTYILGQKEWDDRPLYLFDEWNAYVNGGSAGVDLAQKNLWKAGWRDAVMGPLEFTVYALAVAHAIQDLAPEYLAKHPQFQEFLAYNTERAMAIFNRGRVMDSFKWATQEAYVDKMLHSADAEDFRVFSRQILGRGLAQKTLGF